MDLRRGEVAAVPLLDVAQIVAQRRGGAREAADEGGRKVGEAGRREGGGGEEGARRRGREAAEEEGDEGCAWWRSGEGGWGLLGLVESIYINITVNVDRPVARSTAPSDRVVSGLTCKWAA
jgi:hypothetical protein